MKKKKRFGTSIFVTTVFFAVVSLIIPFFDESITARQTFFRVAGAIVLGFAIYAISTVFEGKSSE